ncbi:hypothetical protein Vadar_006316 [Vaccinium darrowii]|uniref:Uncharacterized protein n=1 Tax=Vaccinium darrowii TaxID=229202 RepID=A0ACB7Y5U6_9ERIC|nr:hypothetical protein Vadar_006316 [Vaccinium darrowii]
MISDQANHVKNTKMKKPNQQNIPVYLIKLRNTFCVHVIGEVDEIAVNDKPVMDGIEKINDKEVNSNMESLVSNGCVDFRGRIADKKTTGGWKASSFIIGNEVAERMAFYSVAVSLVSYLITEMHQPLPDAATHVTDWIGAAFVLTLLGAFLADAYLGRFKTIIIFSCLYAMGLVLLTLSASIDSLRPAKCPPTEKTCIPPQATTGQDAFLFLALGLIALGTGGIKPCVSSLGADQFDEADEKEAQKKYSFFNWFFNAINMGVLLGITVLVYLQQQKGLTWGYSAPTVVMVCSIVILGSGFRFYRFQKPMGSAFARFVQVMVAAVRNHMRGVEVGEDEVDRLYEVKTIESDIHGARKLGHTAQYRFLDKAAVILNPEQAQANNRWNLCTVTQVEEFKSFVRVLPVWATTIALNISFAQISTFFITQDTLTNRRLGSSFLIPPGSVPVFAAVATPLLVPVYEKFIVPLLRRKTGHRRGITSLQRMGVGLFVSIFAMAIAALVERKRRLHYPEPSTMSVFWLFPQFFLIGTAEFFTYVGQLEFFYDEATDGTRSISSAIFLTEVGLGSWLSSAIVKIIQRATGGVQKGWLRNSLNTSRLDYFYWILTGINAVNFFVFLFVAMKYKGRDGDCKIDRDDGVLEMGGLTNNVADEEERMRDKEIIRKLEDKVQAQAGEMSTLKEQVAFLMRHLPGITGLQVRDGGNDPLDQVSLQTHHESSPTSHDLESSMEVRDSGNDPPDQASPQTHHGSSHASHDSECSKECDWIDNIHGKKEDAFKFTLVNFNHLLYREDQATNEPYILASQAEQVWYVPDLIEPDWQVAVKMSERGLYDMHSDDPQVEPYLSQQLEENKGRRDEGISWVREGEEGDIIDV